MKQQNQAGAQWPIGAIMAAVFICFALLSPIIAMAQNNARMLSTPNAQTGTTYTFVAADATRLTTFNNASAVSVTLPSGANQGFGSGTDFAVKNLGAGTVTITCSACTINGQSTLQLAQNAGADIYGGYGPAPAPLVNYIAQNGSGGGAGGAGPYVSADGVQYVSGSGNDANTGLDPGHAKLTIAAALSALPSHGGTVYVGAGTFVTNAIIVIPNKTSIVFTGGRGDAGAGGTVIQAGASFPAGSPVIQFGASAPSFGVILIGPGTVDCNGKTGIGIQNDNAQEMSYARDIDIANCSGPALDIEGSGAQNSGPFSNLHIIPGSTAVAGTLGVKVYNVPAFRGISSVTVDNTGYTSKPTTSVQIDASGFYRGIHAEASTNGIVVGSQIATNSVHVEDFWAASTITTGVVISNAFSTQDILLTNLNSNGATNLVSDQVSGKTLTDGSLALYLLGNGATKEVLTSSANTSSLLQSIAMLGGLNMNGNAISDGSTGGPLSIGLAQGIKTGMLESSGTAAGLSGTGPCATITTQLGGSWSGSFKCTGTTGATVVTITPGSTAPNGWSCGSSDITAGVSGAQSASTTTTCAVKFTSVTANDVLTFYANAF